MRPLHLIAVSLILQIAGSAMMRHGATVEIIDLGLFVSFAGLAGLAVMVGYVRGRIDAWRQERR